MLQERSAVEVSVIIPVFNRRDLVRRAVESVLAQEFHELFEVIVVDDGSTDGSSEAAALDKRVRVVRQARSGSAAARLTGIRESCATYVAFLDSDDVARPQFLRLLHDAVRKLPSVVLAFGRMGDLDAPRASRYTGVRGLVGAQGVVMDPLRALLDIGMICPGMNLLVPRPIALASATGREHVRAATDYDFALRCALHGSFRFVDAETVLWDKRDDGLSRQAGRYQAAFAVLSALDAVALSGRRDAVIREALRRRVEGIWPWAFVELCTSSEWALAFRLARVGATVGRLGPGLRGLYWVLRQRATRTRSLRRTIGAQGEQR